MKSVQSENSTGLGLDSKEHNMYVRVTLVAMVGVMNKGNMGDSNMTIALVGALTLIITLSPFEYGPWLFSVT